MKNRGKSNNESCEAIHPSEWLNHFQKLFNEAKPIKHSLLEELERLENEPHFSELDFRISRNEINKALKRLNKKSAPGPDHISGNLLWAGKDALTPLFDLFFNKTFTHCSQPRIFALNFLMTI